MRDRIILDLCGGTGAWSEPYRRAGYDVRVITKPRFVSTQCLPPEWEKAPYDWDVRLFEYEGRVHGVLAAPPCTYFCRMRMCRGTPTPSEFREGLSVVDACLRIVLTTKPKWWCLENPQGYLKRWLGTPAMKFDPYEFGDPWTKRTWLWGSFSLPLRSPVEPVEGRKVGGKKGDPKDGRAVETARTAPGFAKAFFEANP